MHHTASPLGDAPKGGYIHLVESPSSSQIGLDVQLYTPTIPTGRVPGRPTTRSRCRRRGATPRPCGELYPSPVAEDSRPALARHVPAPLLIQRTARIHTYRRWEQRRGACQSVWRRCHSVRRCKRYAGWTRLDRSHLGQQGPVAPLWLAEAAIAQKGAAGHRVPACDGGQTGAAGDGTVEQAGRPQSGDLAGAHAAKARSLHRCPNHRHGAEEACCNGRAPGEAEGGEGSGSSRASGSRVRGSRVRSSRANSSRANGSRADDSCGNGSRTCGSRPGRVGTTSRPAWSGGLAAGAESWTRY